MSYDIRAGDRVWVGFIGMGAMVGAPSYAAIRVRDGVREVLVYETVDETMNPDADAVAEMRALSAELQALCAANGALFVDEEPE